MAELKHTFTSGRMNKDLDERLIPNGEYIDAKNIQISSSEGSDVGAIENLLGNEKLSKLNLQNAKTLGSIAYSLKNKIYWIVTSDSIDGIYEFDEKQNSISPILIDKKETKSINLEAIVYSNIDNELIIQDADSKLSTLIGNDLPKNIDEEKLVKNNISIVSYDPYIKISIPKNTVIKKDTNEKFVFKNIEYNGNKYKVDLKAVYTSNGILNFSKNNLITGINIIDDLLFWTDNLNQPRRINISSFKKYTDGIEDQDTQIEYAQKDPITKQVTKLKRNFTEDDISVIKKSPMYAPSMELYDSITDGKVDIKYTLNLSNVYIGETFTLDSLADIPSWNPGDFVTIEADGANFTLEASVKSNENSIVEISIATISGEIENQSYDCNINLKQKKALYELNFVRFAYRWKYKNGEYSTLSPFTEPAFYADDFKYDGKEAFNYGMINKLQRIVLNSFDLGNDDISEIDILFKEGRNQNIYVLKTVKKLDFTNEYIITKEQIHSVIPNDQLLRAWDNVPKKAKAQEVTANRIIYGNYTQNYDVYNEPELNISTVARQDDLNRTIKSNRTYQIGVAYIDEYNRHTPVLSNDSGAFNINKDNSVLKNQFSLSLKNQPPAWAKYFKYYIKDTSGEYYNLSADKYYQDTENGFTYISFPSSDRNKITNDHYLILKKKHGANEAVLTQDNRYKIIDIFSDPPEFITNRKRVIGGLGDVVFTSDIIGASSPKPAVTGTGDAPGNAPFQDYARIRIKRADGGESDSTQTPKDGIPNTENLVAGKFMRFRANEKQTDIYEIKGVQLYPDGDTEAEIIFTEPFGDDVNILYDGNNIESFIHIDILENYSAAGDKEFDGRFFVKLKTNGTLINSIVKETVGGISYLAKENITINGVFRKEYDPGLSNNGSFINRPRFKSNALEKLDVPILVAAGGGTNNFITIAGEQYNITLEQATHNNDAQWETLTGLIKTGDFIRFRNLDGSLHHEDIYEISAKKKSTVDRKKNSNEVSLNQLSLRLIDPETKEFKPFTQNTVLNNQDKELILEILQELDEENIIIKDPAIFETEPLEKKTELDIYYETEKAISIDEHGQTHTLNWYNAISFGNGVESNRIRDDFNAIFIDTGVRASTVLAEPFKEEHKFNGLIWSGIINSRSGTNQSNQFNMANAITKDLLPSYGSVQKLFARDGDIVIYCEDKIVRALADKDILYNADGSGNVTASRNVIGNVIPFAGEYGISQNPESFAFYGFRAYNADPKRGVVLRLSRDGITPISAANMGSYFRNTLFGYNDYIVGSYDNRNKLYNISYGNNTACFSEDVNGWVTFKSFIPQNGISLNNIFYSYNKGELWQHDSPNVALNNFYGEQFSSSIELNINDNPSVIKKYKTLGYEGTSGWKANIVTDQQTSSELSFKEKENKYFANIAGEAQDIVNIDNKNISAQGIGRSVRKTTLTFATGDVVVGQNGEIIILGAGNTSIGPDYIITGGNIGYDFDQDGNIVLTGNGIGGSSGTGNTTGGSSIGTGSGGTIIANDTGGGGSDGTGGSGTGSFTDSGGGGTTVDSDLDYSDQIGNTANTTATLELNTSGNFYSKPIEITQAPGEKITTATFTIFPKQGYTISATDFKSDENIVFTQDGDNIKAVLTLDQQQPSYDETFVFDLIGKAEIAPLSASGAINTNLVNSTINNNDLKNYIVDGNYGEEKIISERIITADSGYYLTADSITVDNPDIFIEKIKLSDTSYKIIETVFIPKNTKTNNDYTITVTPLEIVLPDPKIISKTINTDVIPNNNETRELIINGEQNAEFEIILSDTSGIISKQQYKLDITGTKNIPLIFDASDNAETYTLKINNITGTDVDSSFGSQSITLTRNAKGRKTASFLVNYSNTINNNFTVEDYIGESTSRQFSFDLTLPSGSYTIGKQPSSSDISFGNNDNNAGVVLDNISFSTNVLTVSGTLFVNDFQEDEVYTLDISPFVGINVTTTFDASINASDGNPGGNFTIGATSYTVDGGAGLNSTPSVSEYFFTLTPSASYSFKTSIDADDFELLDSSNNDVSADYAANNEILVRKVGDNIEVGFKTKTFIQPSTSSTFTIRPKVGVTITETASVNTINNFFYIAKFFRGVDGTFDSAGSAGGHIYDVNINDDNLVQVTLASSGNIYDSTEFSNSSLFYINNANSSHITLATAGTYGSTTITGPFETNATKDIITVNLIVNLGGDSTLTSGIVDIYVNTVSDKSLDADNNIINKYYLVEVKLADCSEQINAPKENNRVWSPIDESSNIYPKYYATNSVLSEDVRIFERISSAQPIPGNIFGFTATNLIQKNNEKLFTVSAKNTANGFEAGWLFEKSICNLDGSHLNIFTNTIKPELYNDIIKYSYPISSTIFKNEKQTLTGTVKITNKDAYDAIVQDIEAKGYNVDPIQGINVDADTLTFTYDAYFDNNGNSTFDFQILRGADQFGLEFTFDDITSDSNLSNISSESYEMRRKSSADQDSNDHIPDNILDTYNVIEKYNTNFELDRYDDGSGNFDSNSTRVTTNTPQDSSFGYTGDAQNLTIIEQSIIDGNGLIQYLNGNAAAGLLSTNFKWYREDYSTYPSGYKVDAKAKTKTDGPVSGSHQYTKTGFTVILEQKDVPAVSEYYELWDAINDGNITSLKIPINLIVPQSKNVTNEIVSTERLFKSTVDINGGYAALEETGWWGGNDRTNRWKNYYIGKQNIYISETVGDGLYALPDYKGIRFTFGITIKRLADNDNNILAFAELPFRMAGWDTISNKLIGTSYTIVANSKLISSQISSTKGNAWDFEYHEKNNYNRTVGKMMGSRVYYGMYQNFQLNYIKFHTP